MELIVLRFFGVVLLWGIAHASAAAAVSHTAQLAITDQMFTTKIVSTTETSLNEVRFISPRGITLLTTITATSLIPGPVPSALPATVVETVISHITFEFRTTYRDAGTPPATSMSSTIITIPHTWIVASRRPSDLAATAALPACSTTCASGKAPSAPGYPQCESQGLQTGCQGRQCEMRDGAWWCYQLYASEYRDEKLRMGRACWGKGGRYEQLNTPCLEGDYQMACTPCQGVDDGWGAVHWSGPEGNP